MKNDFKLSVGDIVVLNSGGPKMTIVGIGVYSYEPEVRAKCTWFDGKKHKEALFVLESLSLSNENGKGDK